MRQRGRPWCIYSELLGARCQQRPDAEEWRSEGCGSVGEGRRAGGNCVNKLQELLPTGRQGQNKNSSGQGARGAIDSSQGRTGTTVRMN